MVHPCRSAHVYPVVLSYISPCHKYVVSVDEKRRCVIFGNQNPMVFPVVWIFDEHTTDRLQDSLSVQSHLSCKCLPKWGEEQVLLGNVTR